MDIKIENGKIIFSENNIKYSFDAHGEYPRPSIMPAISVGGKHLSNRSEDIKIEKHTAVQDIAIGNNMAAWYTQKFLPDGADYKLSKKASIYIGDFSTGKEKLIYKGECYGDLCFYENDLFFNIGNKVAVYHLNSGESEVLFKHSGIKKSGIDLHITPKRIFFSTGHIVITIQCGMTVKHKNLSIRILMDLLCFSLMMKQLSTKVLIIPGFMILIL